MVCITVSCVVGLTANIATFCATRKWWLRKKNKIPRQRKQQQQQQQQRVEANCPFVVNEDRDEDEQQKDEGEGSNEQSSTLNVRSLEEFFELQYSLQSEANMSENNRMSWV